MRNIFSTWITMLFALWFAPAFGTQFVPLSVAELTEKSDIVVHGTVVSSTSREDAAGRIYTQVGIQVAEVWKGTPQPVIIQVVLGGGTVGNRRVVVSGQVQYEVGEEVVAFLVFNERKQAVTIGLAQGKFHVWTDSESGEKLAANPFHGTGFSGPTLDSLKGKSAVSRLTVSTLKSQVQGGRQ